jgi:hypothetical protein
MTIVEALGWLPLRIQVGIRTQLLPERVSSIWVWNRSVVAYRDVLVGL